ncbi:asparagine synthase (glutamine-hydrolyzing) [Nitratifractor sp.]
MCGIVGLLSKRLPSKEHFIEALNLQIHRGPDDSGVVAGRGFIFGHRRLSIIDLDSHAKQPMVSADGNCVVIFNGEIYNYIEIRENLVKKGYRFKTASDTEVLLNAFIEYGIGCLEKFIGMFAFAIHDKKANTTYIVRDRLGIKPLYYSSDEEAFCFASEIKSLLALTQKKELNTDALSSYLSFRYPILDDTFFKGIYSLPPAHYIKITANKREFVEYWSLKESFLQQREDKGEEYYKERVRNLLESSVVYRMRSDVEFGAFLSGGVDSSVITALMAKNTTKPIRTFTIGFEEDGFNEFSYAKMVARRYATNHTEILLSGENYIETMQELIAFKDAPLSVPNEVPLYLMSKELKKYITVVLSGEGADEIFGGYGRIFRSPFDYERMRDLDKLDYDKKEKEKFIKNFDRKYGKKIFANELEHFLQLYSYTPFSMKKSFLSPVIDLKKIEAKFYEKFKKYFNEIAGESYYNKMMYAFEKIHLVGLLHRVDTSTMAASVEARVPFVDHRVVEEVFTIPVKYKLKWLDEAKAKTMMSDAISEKYDVPKYILKKSFDDMLPKEVLYRKKMGFPVPLNKWFGGDFNNYAKGVLLSQKARKRGIYNTKDIEHYLRSDRIKKEHSFAMKIWMLVNLELFMQQYFEESI